MAGMPGGWAVGVTAGGAAAGGPATGGSAAGGGAAGGAAGAPLPLPEAGGGVWVGAAVGARCGGGMRVTGTAVTGTCRAAAGAGFAGLFTGDFGSEGACDIAGVLQSFQKPADGHPRTGVSSLL